jgi:tetratricopeptide (TPR) repeat protein
LYGRARRIFEDASDNDGVANAMHNLGELELHAGDVGKAKQLFERALSITRDEGYTAMLLHSLGDVSLEENDFRRAEAFYRDSLKRWISSRPDAWRFHVYCLAGLSAAAAATGDLPRAGRLWGAVERIEDSTGATLQSSARSRYERLLHEPGQNIAGDAVEEGRAMTPEAALVYAFEPGE